MFEQINWDLVIWTGAVFLSGYLLGSRKSPKLEEPVNFDQANVSPDARVQIEQALQAGHKIEAIRVLRKDAGLGLKDAKTVIDRWNRM